MSLQQLTLMRCRLARLPASLSTLTSLRVLYLDMGFAGPPLEGALPMAEQADAVLAPLERLAILSMGACHLREVPRCLMRATALRVLYLDDNELGALPTGSYLGALRVLGVDWRVLFASHARLGDAPRLTKLCLTSIGKGVEAGEGARQGGAMYLVRAARRMSRSERRGAAANALRWASLPGAAQAGPTRSHAPPHPQCRTVLRIPTRWCALSFSTRLCGRCCCPWPTASARRCTLLRSTWWLALRATWMCALSHTAASPTSGFRRCTSGTRKRRWRRASSVVLEGEGPSTAGLSLELPKSGALSSSAAAFLLRGALFACLWRSI